VSVELVLTASTDKRLRYKHHVGDGRLVMTADVHVNPDEDDAGSWVRAELLKVLDWAASAVSIDG
jgi:hypothetical protein